MNGLEGTDPNPAWADWGEPSRTPPRGAGIPICYSVSGSSWELCTDLVPDSGK